MKQWSYSELAELKSKRASLQVTSLQPEILRFRPDDPGAAEAAAGHNGIAAADGPSATTEHGHSTTTMHRDGANANLQQQECNSTARSYTLAELGSQLRTSKLQKLTQGRSATTQTRPAVSNTTAMSTQRVSPGPLLMLSTVLSREPRLLDHVKLSAVERFITHLDMLPAKAQNVELVYLSKNSLISLENIQQFAAVRTLSLADNLLLDLEQVLDVLCMLPQLQVLSLEGNPCTQVPYYRPRTLARLPQLRLLDGKTVSDHEAASAGALVEQEQAYLAVMMHSACLVHKLGMTCMKLQVHRELMAQLYGRKAWLLHGCAPTSTHTNPQRLLELWDYEGAMNQQERDALRAAIRREVVRRKQPPTTSTAAASQQAWREAFAQVMLCQQQCTASLLERVQHATADLQQEAEARLSGLRLQEDRRQDHVRQHVHQQDREVTLHGFRDVVQQLSPGSKVCVSHCDSPAMACGQHIDVPSPAALKSKATRVLFTATQGAASGGGFSAQRKLEIESYGRKQQFHLGTSHTSHPSSVCDTEWSDMHNAQQTYPLTASVLDMRAASTTASQDAHLANGKGMHRAASVPGRGGHARSSSRGVSSDARYSCRRSRSADVSLRRGGRRQAPASSGLQTASVTASIPAVPEGRLKLMLRKAARQASQVPAPGPSSEQEQDVGMQAPAWKLPGTSPVRSPSPLPMPWQQQQQASPCNIVQPTATPPVTKQHMDDTAGAEDCSILLQSTQKLQQLSERMQLLQQAITQQAATPCYNTAGIQTVGMTDGMTAPAHAGGQPVSMDLNSQRYESERDLSSQRCDPLRDLNSQRYESGRPSLVHPSSQAVGSSWTGAISLGAVQLCSQGADSCQAVPSCVRLNQGSHAVPSAEPIDYSFQPGTQMNTAFGNSMFKASDKVNVLNGDAAAVARASVAAPANKLGMAEDAAWPIMTCGVKLQPVVYAHSPSPQPQPIPSCLQALQHISKEQPWSAGLQQACLPMQTYAPADPVIVWQPEQARHEVPAAVPSELTIQEAMSAAGPSRKAMPTGTGGPAAYHISVSSSPKAHTAPQTPVTVKSPQQAGAYIQLNRSDNLQGAGRQKQQLHVHLYPPVLSGSTDGPVQQVGNSVASSYGSMPASDAANTASVSSMTAAAAAGAHTRHTMSWAAGSSPGMCQHSPQPLAAHQGTLSSSSDHVAATPARLEQPTATAPVIGTDNHTEVRTGIRTGGSRHSISRHNQCIATTSSHPAIITAGTAAGLAQSMEGEGIADSRGLSHVPVLPIRPAPPASPALSAAHMPSRSQPAQPPEGCAQMPHPHGGQEPMGASAAGATGSLHPPGHVQSPGMYVHQPMSPGDDTAPKQMHVMPSWSNPLIGAGRQGAATDSSNSVLQTFTSQQMQGSQQGNQQGSQQGNQQQHQQGIQQQGQLQEVKTKPPVSNATETVPAGVTATQAACSSTWQPSLLQSLPGKDRAHRYHSKRAIHQDQSMDAVVVTRLQPAAGPKLSLALKAQNVGGVGSCSACSSPGTDVPPCTVAVNPVMGRMLPQHAEHGNMLAHTHQDAESAARLLDEARDVASLLLQQQAAESGALVPRDNTTSARIPFSGAAVKEMGCGLLAGILEKGSLQQALLVQQGHGALLRQELGQQTSSCQALQAALHDVTQQLQDTQQALALQTDTVEELQANCDALQEEGATLQLDRDAALQHLQQAVAQLQASQNAQEQQHRRQEQEYHTLLAQLEQLKDEHSLVLAREQRAARQAEMAEALAWRSLAARTLMQWRQATRAAQRMRPQESAADHLCDHWIQRRVWRAWWAYACCMHAAKCMSKGLHAKTLAAAWQAWQAHITKCRDKAATLQMAQQQLAGAMQRRAFLAWHQLAEMHAAAAQHENVQALMTAAGFAFASLQQRAWMAWKEVICTMDLPTSCKAGVTSTLVHAHARAKRCRHRQLTARAWSAWHAYLHHRQLKAQAWTCATRRWQRNLLTRALEAWAVAQVFMHRKRQLLSTAAVHWRHRLLSAWAAQARWAAHINRKVAGLQGQRTSQLLAHAMSCWRSAATEQARLRLLEVVSAEHWSRGLQQRCLWAWRAVSHAATAARNEAQGVAELQQVLQVAVRWRRVSEALSRQAAVQARGDRMYRHRTLHALQRQMLREWHAAAVWAIHSRRTTAAAYTEAVVVLDSHTCLLHAFYHWRGVLTARWRAAVRQQPDLQALVLELEQKLLTEQGEKTQLSVQVAHLDSMHAELLAAGAEAEAKQQQLSHMEGRCEVLTRERDALLSEVQSLNQQLLRTEAERDAAQAETASKQAALETAHMGIRDLQLRSTQQVGQHALQVESLREDLSDKTRDLSVATTTNSRLQEELQELKAQLQHLQQTSSSQLNNLVTELNDRDDRLNALMEQLEGSSVLQQVTGHMQPQNGAIGMGGRDVQIWSGSGPVQCSSSRPSSAPYSVHCVAAQPPMSGANSILAAAGLELRGLNTSQAVANDSVASGMQCSMSHRPSNPFVCTADNMPLQQQREGEEDSSITSFLAATLPKICSVSMNDAASV